MDEWLNPPVDITVFNVMCTEDEVKEVYVNGKETGKGLLINNEKE